MPLMFFLRPGGYHDRLSPSLGLGRCRETLWRMAMGHTADRQLGLGQDFVESHMVILCSILFHNDVYIIGFNDG